MPSISPAIIPVVPIDTDIYTFAYDRNHTLGFISTKAKDVFNDEIMDIKLMLAPQLVRKKSHHEQKKQEQDQLFDREQMK